MNVKLTEKSGKVCTLYVVAVPELKTSSYTVKIRTTNAISISSPSRALTLQEIMPCAKLGRLKYHPSFSAVSEGTNLRTCAELASKKSVYQQPVAAKR